MLDVHNRASHALSPELDATLVAKVRDRMGYAYIVAFVGAVYAAIAGTSMRYSATILPMGDPFTYTTGFFNLLDIAKRSYWAGIQRAFEANWYWMMNVPIALLSPVLVKEPVALSLVNFIVWGIATASFFRLARVLGYGVGAAILVGLVNWLYPVNFGFLDYTSIPVVALDAMFLGLLTVEVANLLVFAVDPLPVRNALWAGLAAGFAVWGRGNSVVVVGMIAFVPAVIGLLRLWQLRPAPLWRNVAIVLGIPAVMLAAFFLKQGGPIATYYYAHLQFVERHAWTWNDAAPYLKNVPGFFFWRVENSALTIGLTWFFHALVALTPLLVWRLERAGRLTPMKTVAMTGAFIYYVTYVANILLFTDPLMNIYNALLIWAPMRIGMTLCIFAIIGTLLNRGAIRIGDGVAIPAMILTVAYGAAMTQFQTPKAVPGIPTPKEMESFVDSLERMEPGASVSVLWYRHYSPSILRYYRAKNDLPELNLYMNTHYNEIWEQFGYTEEKRMIVRQEIAHHFEEAGLIIMAEYEDYYSLGMPYSFYQFRDEFSRYLNSPSAPKFVVRAILQEFEHQRLMVLQRQEDARGRGEPLKLPYGSSSKPHAEYGPAVLRF